MLPGAAQSLRRRFASRKWNSRVAAVRNAAAGAVGRFIESLEQRQMLSVVAPSHIVVVVEEDRFANAIGDTTNMPYTNQLASMGLVYSNSHGLNTQSQEGEMNYLALFSGSTQGETGDGFDGPYSTANLAQSLYNKGLTFTGYAEAMPHDGDIADHYAASPTNPDYDDLYIGAYNPMAQFENVGTGISNSQVNQTFASFPTSASGYMALPTVSFIIPDTADNSHGSNDTDPYATDPDNYDMFRQNADMWLQHNLSGYVQWAQQNNSILIITGDEGDRAHGFTSLATNDITTIIVGASGIVVPGVDSTSITPYNILRTIEDMYGLTALGNTATASELSTNAQGQLAAPNSQAATSTALVAQGPNPATTAQSISLTVNTTGVPDGGTVTIEDASNGNAIVATTGGPTSGGTETLTIAAGVLSVGTHNLFAVYAGDSTHAGSQSSQVSQTINPAVAAPTLVGSPVINGDDPNGLYTAAGQTANGKQRSMVKDVVYTFNEAVTIPSASAAFTVAVAAGETGTVPTSLTVTAVPGSNGTQWAVTLTGKAPGVLASIADGVYTITLNPAGVFAAADGTTAMAPGTGQTDTFYRLFGDITGDHVVNAADNLKFRTALSVYNAIFDYNGDGAVNAADNLKFRAALSITLGDFETTI